MIGNMLAVVVAGAGDVVVVAVASALMAVTVFVRLQPKAVKTVPEAVRNNPADLPWVASAVALGSRVVDGCPGSHRNPHAVSTWWSILSHSLCCTRLLNAPTVATCGLTDPIVPLSEEQSSELGNRGENPSVVP